jgi:transcriptional regulator with PAS, ATPase and Fis domain
MYARWVHARSARRAASFVEVNCSLLRGELLASELFGHARGAFTSAHESRTGLLDLAHRGTLFLDEIGDMDAGIQAQFLKVVEEKSYRRLGETTLRRSNFRLLAATNHEIEEDVRAGRFRADLFYRLGVLVVRIPPLRERIEDIPALLDYMLASAGAADRPLPPALVERLARYPWPGNIREVRNVIERALLLAADEPLAPSHFPGLDPCPSTRADSAPDTIETLDLAEARHIGAAIESVGGDVSKAARALGISRASLYRKLKQHGMGSRSPHQDEGGTS